MSPIWHIGRKAIIAYLRPYLGLSMNHEIAWNMIRRWKAKFKLPIETQPNRKPYIDPETFELYWLKYQERFKRLKNKQHKKESKGF